MRPTIAAVVCGLGVLLWVAQAHADKQYDVVYVDHMSAVLVPYQIGWGASDFGFAVVVNSGSEPLSLDDLGSATLAVTSATTNAHFLCAIGSLANYAPLGAGEALGNINQKVALLETLLQPTETLRNVTPASLFAYSVSIPSFNFSGTLHFDVSITIAGRTAACPVDVVVAQGTQFSVNNDNVARVGAGSVLPVLPTSWGRVKALYR